MGVLRGVPLSSWFGQAFHTGGWLWDKVGLDWSYAEPFAGTNVLYSDLAKLRGNANDDTRGLARRVCQIVRVDENARSSASTPVCRWTR